MTSLKTLASLAALLILTGCGGEYAQSSIDPVTDFAETIHGLYRTITIWSIIILAVVWVLLAYVLIRFRERPGTPHPKQIHGSMALEIAWTIGPALIVVAIAIPTIQAVFATQRGDPENAMVVEVIGHQFWWEFRYPDYGVVTANEMHLPVGQPISLRIHSADVIHSFWVPQMGGKRDANPLVARPEGESLEYNWIHFTVFEPGTYLGQCAEFCGESHSLMGMQVVAQSPEEFRAWIADWRDEPLSSVAAIPVERREASLAALPPGGAEPSPDPASGTVTAEQEYGPTAQEAPREEEAESPEATGETGLQAPELPDQLPPEVDPQLVAQGRDVFLNQSFCVACHGVQGTSAQGVIGPNLTLMGRRNTIGAGWMDNTLENLEAWIRSPHAIKPGVLMPGVDREGGGWPATGLSDEQVRALAHYLYSLR